MPRFLSTSSVLVLALAGALTGCYSVPPEVRDAPVAPDAKDEPRRPIGGDKDAHGCPISAGYTWCERERSCVRPWELAATAGFADNAEAFDAYCNAPAARN